MFISSIKHEYEFYGNLIMKYEQFSMFIKMKNSSSNREKQLNYLKQNTKHNIIK